MLGVSTIFGPTAAASASKCSKAALITADRGIHSAADIPLRGEPFPSRTQSPGHSVAASGVKGAASYSCPLYIEAQVTAIRTRDRQSSPQRAIGPSVDRSYRAHVALV